MSKTKGRVSAGRLAAAISYRLIDEDGASCTKGGAELLNRWRGQAGSFIWLSIVGPLDGAVADLLRREFNLNDYALQDAARNRHPPKVEPFDGCTFAVLKEFVPAEGDAAMNSIDDDTLQVAMFVGGRFLVTRCSGRSQSLLDLAGELEAVPDGFSNGPAALAVRLTRLVVNRYLRVLLAFEPRLEQLEDSLLAGDNEAALTEMVRCKSSLVRLQRNFRLQSGVTALLRDESLPGFERAPIHAMNDAHEQQERITSLVTLYYQLATDLIEGYISVSSHRLNQIMRVLTIITAIFVPLSFLAGVYGMNFEYMPELKWRLGYFALLGLMAAVVLTLLLVFRRRRWL